MVVIGLNPYPIPISMMVWRRMVADDTYPIPMPIPISIHAISAPDLRALRWFNVDRDLNNKKNLEENISITLASVC